MFAQQRPSRNEYDDNEEAEFSYGQRGRGKHLVLVAVEHFIQLFNGISIFGRNYEEKRHEILNQYYALF